MAQKTGSAFHLKYKIIKHLNLYYSSKNPDKIQDNLDAMFKDADYNVYMRNIAENARQTRKLFLLIAIFLYSSESS